MPQNYMIKISNMNIDELRRLFKDILEGFGVKDMITLFSQESAIEAYGADREIKGAVEVYQEFGATFEERIKTLKFSTLLFTIRIISAKAAERRSPMSASSPNRAAASPRISPWR